MYRTILTAEGGCKTVWQTTLNRLSGFHHYMWNPCCNRAAGFLCHVVLESKCLQMTHTHTHTLKPSWRPQDNITTHCRCHTWNNLFFYDYDAPSQLPDSKLVFPGWKLSRYSVLCGKTCPIKFMKVPLCFLFHHLRVTLDVTLLRMKMGQFLALIYSCDRIIFVFSVIN